jgi:hypothetical protein
MLGLAIQGATLKNQFIVSGAGIWFLVVSKLTAIVGSSTAQAASPPPSMHPYSTFNTARNFNARSNVYGLTHDSSSVIPQPAKPFPVVSVNEGKVGRTTPSGQFDANAHSSPANSHATAFHRSLRTQSPHISRNLHARPNRSRTSPVTSLASDNGANISLHPLGTLTSLNPPAPAVSNNCSPSSLPKPDTEITATSKTILVPRGSSSRSTKTPEIHQAVFVNSPIDYSSRLDSRMTALPSQPASIPEESLITRTTPVKSSLQEPQIRMCVVCFDQEPDVRFAARCPTAQCEHGISVCTACLERHILVAAHNCRTVDIRCPHEGCGRTLAYQDVYSSVRDWGQLV